MSVQEQIQKLAQEFSGELKEKQGLYELSIPIAERKTFLSKQKLVYLARFRIDEAEKRLRFNEMLQESGTGLSGGDSDLTPGFGFKKESYNTFSGKRSGTIEEQSRLLGKKYEYRFDFTLLRKRVEEITQKEGYTFEYQITPLGL